MESCHGTLFGFDVSLKQTAICVVNQAGSIVQEGVVDSDPGAIAGFMRSKAPGRLPIAPRVSLHERGSRGLEIANVVARHDRCVRVVSLELQAVAGGEAAKP